MFSNIEVTTRPGFASVLPAPATHRLRATLRKAMFAAALTAAAAAGFAADVPASLAGVTLVTAEQAMKLEGTGVPIIDTRVGNEYADSHIKGARNVPYKEKSAKDAAFDAKASIWRSCRPTRTHR